MSCFFACSFTTYVWMGAYFCLSYSGHVFFNFRNQVFNPLWKVLLLSFKYCLSTNLSMSLNPSFMFFTSLSLHASFWSTYSDLPSWSLNLSAIIYNFLFNLSNRFLIWITIFFSISRNSICLVLKYLFFFHSILVFFWFQLLLLCLWLCLTYFYSFQ